MNNQNEELKNNDNDPSVSNENIHFQGEEALILDYPFQHSYNKALDFFQKYQYNLLFLIADIMMTVYLLFTFKLYFKVFNILLLTSSLILILAWFVLSELYYYYATKFKNVSGSVQFLMNTLAFSF